MKLFSRLSARLTAVFAAAVTAVTVAPAPANAFAGAPENVSFVRIADRQLDLTFVDRAAGELEFQIEYRRVGNPTWALVRTHKDTRPGQPAATGMTVRVNNLPLDTIGGCYKVWARGSGGRVSSAPKCTNQAPYAMKMARVLSWTASSVDSYNGWVYALENKSLFTEFNLDWETNICTAGPDQPAGYDFRMSCRRHDFGYGNFQRLDVFDEYKSRVDNSFLADLYRKCDTYDWWVREPCYGIANLYYSAVVVFGFTAGRVSQEEIDRHARWRAQLEAEHAANS